MSKTSQKTGVAPVSSDNSESFDGINPNLIPLNKIGDAITEVNAIISRLQGATGDALSPNQRRTKRSAGVRNYGFMDKVSDIATANPEFVPGFFSVLEMKNLIRHIELLRDLAVALERLLRLVRDEQLLASDETFNMALMYYNSVRDLARRRVPGAEAVFRELQLFFRRRRTTAAEPTEKQVLRDVKAGLHGKKDVDIRIKHESPHTVGGEHIVIDETHRPKGEWKATEQGEIND